MLHEARRSWHRTCWTAGVFAVVLTADVASAQLASSAAAVSRIGEELPVFFVPNRGAMEPSRYRYVVRDSIGSILFADDHIVIRRSRPSQEEISVRFCGARVGARVSAAGSLGTKVHWFRGPASDWETEIPTYASVVYWNLWPGIDLTFQADQGRIKYAFHVSPGADPDRIRLRYDGVKTIRSSYDGSLRLTTEAGTVICDDAPIAWQVMRGEKLPVPVNFVVDGDREVGFIVEGYDPTQGLVIDPAVLVYCGYAGSNSTWLNAIAVDSQEAVVLVGASNMGPTNYDVCVLKVSPDGSRLLFVTYISGANAEIAYGVAVDAGDAIYVAGFTQSDETSFPVKVGPDLTFNGKPAADSDGFVCKLTQDGSGIVYCGYVGGSGYDRFTTIAIDGIGRAWLGGYTSSGDYPVKGSFSSVLSTAADAVVSKISADGKSVLISRYVGGKGSDFCRGIAVDSHGDAYVTGSTTSDEKSFPVCVGPDINYNSSMSIWPEDAFVAKIDGVTGTLRYCGYIGGSGAENGLGVAVDSAGCAHVAGTTSSDEQTFPLKGGPYLKGTDGFLVKVDASGQSFAYSGLLPGVGAFAVALDTLDNAVVAGVGYPRFATTPGGLSTFSGGVTDVCVLKVLPSGNGIQWGASFGGAIGYEQAVSLALDPTGNAYLCGWTDGPSSAFPVKVGPGTVFNGTTGTSPHPGQFVAKVAEVTLAGSGSPKIGQTIQWSLTATDDAMNTYQMGTSRGAGPIRIDQRTLGLGMDDLLQASVFGGVAGLFTGYQGVLDQRGTASGALQIPNIKGLIGLRLFSAFITLNPNAPSGVQSISNTIMFAISS